MPWPCAPTWRRIWRATFSPSTCAPRARPSSKRPGCGWRRGGAGIPAVCWCNCKSMTRWRTGGRRAARRWSTARARCSRPTSAMSSPRACRACKARAAVRPRCCKCMACCNPYSSRWGCACKGWNCPAVAAGAQRWTTRPWSNSAAAVRRRCCSARSALPARWRRWRRSTAGARARWNRPICGMWAAMRGVCGASAPPPPRRVRGAGSWRVRRAKPWRARRARPRQRTTQPTRAETDMAREHSKDVVVGLDIGTAKVMVVVAEVLPQGELKIAGLGVAPSNGLKRGVVVNIDATVQSIQQALKEAELMADCKIQRVYTGITGSHIRGLNSSGMVAVKDKEVTSADVARVIETAKAINISSDQRLLLAEPQEFVIDGEDVKEPIGMSGLRLEAKIHIVTGAQSAAENIIKCVRRCGLEVEQLMLNPLASSQAVLTDDERELGVVVV